MKITQKIMMQSFNYLILVFCLCVMAAGCRTGQPTTPTHSVVKDSVSVVTNYVKKDTTIIVKGDTLRLEVPVYSLTQKPIFLKQNGLNMQISKVHDTIKAHCYTDHLEKIIELQNKIITTYKSQKQEQTKEVIKVHIPLIYKVFALLGFAFVMVIVGFAISKMRFFI